ncbi:serine/threonine protein kinase, partial [Trypanosoma cruzi]
MRSETFSSRSFGSLREAGNVDVSLERCTSACSDSKNNHADDSGRVISQWDRFPRSQQIGTGSFGNVFLCHDMLPGSPWYRQPVAVKAVPLDALTDSGVMLAMNEVAILRHLRHPNILHYIAVFGHVYVSRFDITVNNVALMEIREGFQALSHNVGDPVRLNPVIWTRLSMLRVVQDGHRPPCRQNIF